MPSLIEPITLRSLTIPNRIWMTPMCMYSAAESGPAIGQVTDFHVAHQAARAAGGVGLVMTESTAVTIEGRITPNDLGIWDDAQVPGLRRLTDIVKSLGAVPGIQLGHAGRKASTAAPWKGKGPVLVEDGGWQTVAPSAIANPGLPEPRELTTTELDDLVEAYVSATARALQAGYQVLEIHGAHGYLLNEFLSPAANHRTDEYGGSFENRVRFPLRVVDAVRAVWPEELPLFFRTSATDWIVEHDPEAPGWTGGDTDQLAVLLKEHGVDLLDCSTGGMLRTSTVPAGPGYQVRFAASARAHSGLPTAAVGIITDPDQAQDILDQGFADAIFLGRTLLRDPAWANRAVKHFGGQMRWPEQYDYAIGQR